MTEYEMVYLLNEFLNFLETIIETFITLLFAFVIVGYMASAKLTRPMAWFIVFVFSSLALRYISGWYTYSADVTALSEQAFQAKLQPGTALGFLFTKNQPDVAIFIFQRNTYRNDIELYWFDRILFLCPTASSGSIGINRKRSSLINN